MMEEKENIRRFCRYIRVSGNNIRYAIYVLLVLAFAVFYITWWYSGEAIGSYCLTVSLMLLTDWLKYTSITEMNVPGIRAQHFSKGMMLLPVSRTEVIRRHFLELLKPQLIMTIQLGIVFLSLNKSFLLIDIFWIFLLVVIPGFIVVIRDRKLFFSE